jgi:hypothetical protein
MFTVKVFDMPTVTDQEVISGRYSAIAGRILWRSLNKLVISFMKESQSRRSEPIFAALVSLWFAAATVANVAKKASLADPSSQMDAGSGRVGREVEAIMPPTAV